MPEKLHANEQFRPTDPRSAPGADRVTVAQVTMVYQVRTQMLGSVERYVTVKMRQALREKLELEKKSLLDIIAQYDKARVAAQRANQTLNKAFFEQRSLDVSSLF